MRSFGLEESGGLFGAIAYTFCGYLVTFGNSWIQTLDCAAYLPWVLLYGLRVVGKGSYANFMTLIGIRVLVLLVGYPQLYVYITTFEVLTVTAIWVASHYPEHGNFDVGRSSTRLEGGNVALYIFSHVAALGIVMPILLSTFHHASVSLTRKNVLDWNTYSANSYDIKLWLNGMLTPLHESGIATWDEQQFLSHIGYLSVFFAAVALLSVRKSNYRVPILVCTGCAVIALLWSTDMVVTRLVYYLPVFNRFKYPFKLSLFSSFYLIVIASFGFDHFCKKIAACSTRGRSALRVLVPMLLALHFLNFLGIYGFSRQHSFAQMLDPVPFDETLKETLSQGRIVSVIEKDINDNPLGKAIGFTVPLIGYDYATMWGLYHMGGHDSLVPEENFNAAFQLDYDSMFKVRPGFSLDEELSSSLEYFNLWGVRWCVVDKALPVINVDGLKLFHEDSFRRIYSNASALPFAFWDDSLEQSGIKFEFRTNSIVLHTQRSSAGRALINVLWNPFFSAKVDDSKAVLTATNGKQVSLEVPAGNHVVVVRYSDPYFTAGLFISFATLAVIIAYGWWRRRSAVMQRECIPQHGVKGL
jgi:hypothetical protein